ncbi:hypothetical protein GUITHDRAFT_122038 [Guillardia theta CCMP2712]|uniref:Uncharacterized protein n=1 Tax=Guillardia theta (strain CCMP2712) TaxID=905079 RepID=L1I6A2_GUITC|nr:hypothetical protein GUITHDRAFT_122038 [Guillardia theta CCMP2712]EKX31773.1 hypothetical protein GUITHDRAFT_122038 [Guillardia theta CCMP2712]|eukprot:XP_005818753.1 hypothetical protein GUITHDRAFT_122038 [Guillardia theta CCMP2712]
MAMVGAAEALVGGGRGGSRHEVMHGAARFDPRSSRRPTAKGTGDVWAEERKLAAAMEHMIVRKVGLRRWLEERRDFWPTEVASERRRVEMEEERKEDVLRREGWGEGGGAIDGFEKLKRARWEETAMSDIRDSQGDGERGKGLIRYIQDNGDVKEIDTRSWPTITLGSNDETLRIRGGGNEKTEDKETNMVKKDNNFRWRSMLDNVVVIEMKRKDGLVDRFSISGIVLDCFLASQMLVAVQILVDFFIAIPVLKLYSQFVVQLLLPSMSEFPAIAEMSIMACHWGLRTWSFLKQMAVDERFKSTLTFSGISLRFLSCEIPGLLFFIWAACSRRDGEPLTMNQLVGLDSQGLGKFLSDWKGGKLSLPLHLPMKDLPRHSACDCCPSSPARSSARVPNLTRSEDAEESSSARYLRKELESRRQEVAELQELKRQLLRLELHKAKLTQECEKLREEAGGGGAGGSKLSRPDAAHLVQQLDSSRRPNVMKLAGESRRDLKVTNHTQRSPAPSSQLAEDEALSYESISNQTEEEEENLPASRQNMTLTGGQPEASSSCLAARQERGKEALRDRERRHKPRWKGGLGFLLAPAIQLVSLLNRKQ